jgi:hypothetical protein
MGEFHKVMSGYYREKSRRSEDCLSDIMDLLDKEPDASLRDAIYTRLIAHWSRDENPTPHSGEE